ncbi:hypothetical protein [Microvirga yunnanensis]|uniref:hypothetical protein n=1 Tax=Microvirga yunnanensis TaxID=2953740 RepID=UPI0021C8BEE2|nr:hypothetical protein [Microvirga sp. HBU65207]
MPRPDQPASSHPAINEQRRMLQDTLDRVEQSRRELEDIRARSEAIAALAQTLNRMAEDDEASARA